MIGRGDAGDRSTVIGMLLGQRPLVLIDSRSSRVFDAFDSRPPALIGPGSVVRAGKWLAGRKKLRRGACAPRMHGPRT